MQEIEFTTNQPEETFALAEVIGQKLRGGEAIELKSDVGGGKTQFVKGLAGGAGVSELVSSPSFTVSNVYAAKHFKLHHFDFYRLDDPGVMRDSLSETLEDPKSVSVIEWPGLIEDVLPEIRLVISFKVLSETKRKILIRYPGQLAYLIPKGSPNADSNDSHR